MAFRRLKLARIGMFLSQNLAHEKIKNTSVMPAKARSAARWHPENAIKSLDASIRS
jgi:hypothetical protein